MFFTLKKGDFSYLWRFVSGLNFWFKDVNAMHLQLLWRVMFLSNCHQGRCSSGYQNRFMNLFQLVSTWTLFLLTDSLSIALGQAGQYGIIWSEEQSFLIRSNGFV
jgi:hypothetical protein